MLEFWQDYLRGSYGNNNPRNWLRNHSSKRQGNVDLSIRFQLIATGGSQILIELLDWK